MIGCKMRSKHKATLFPFGSKANCWRAVESMEQETLTTQITALGEEIRLLKTSQDPDDEIIKEKVALLKEWKKQLKEATPKKNITLKTPKGTKDYNDKEMALREKIFSTIINIFKRHGGVTIDTPVFELKEILSGKYGEDSKLIYDLSDQGGELCSLRYDLTVPFARFLAMNGSVYQNIKRYQIAKVYRRDQPAMTKGRMREFYQCDFDIAGQYDPMLPDAEALRVMWEVLTELEVGKFVIKVNHRKLLDGIFDICGVPADKFRTICSAVDKLDKASWEEVLKEMTEEKGLSIEVANKIGEYVLQSGGHDLLQKLKADAQLASHPTSKKGLEDMTLLLNYLDVLGVLADVSFDLSLARGLDYYTGVIYEAVLIQPAASKLSEDAYTGLGSIAAGGRYDELVSIFSSGKGKSGQIPCVGLSIGIERVYSILLKKQRLEDIKSNEVQVFVISVGQGHVEERMKICKELWENNIKAEFMYKTKPRLQPQFNSCERDRIPLAVIIGEDEIANGVAKVKSMLSKEGNDGGELVQRKDLVEVLKVKLSSM